MQRVPINITPEYILETIIRRRWFLIIPFIVALLVGIYFAFTLPKVYEASTMILVQAQRVPTNYVKPVVTTDIVSRLRTISQQILSRTNIERIINDYKLFSGPDNENMFMEDKVENVRNRISVNVSQSSTFSISFKGQDPKKVTNIANALATYFIDENLKVREAQAIGTSTFLDDELETMRVSLEAREKTLRDYRQKFMGELPDQLDTNLSVLQRLSEDLIEKQKALRESKSTLNALKTQISESQKNKNVLNLDDFDAGDSDMQDSAEVSELKNRLAVLKIRYTDQHPDVVRLKAMIDKLEAEQKSDAETPEADGQPLDDDLAQFDFMSLQRAQLQEAQNQVTNLELEAADLKNKIVLYQKRVDNTPKRQEELLAITRDYDNLKSSYDNLLNRRLEAQISVNMEKKQKGEQFEIVDPARVPEKPISPNLKRHFLMTVMAGLAMGCGIVFILEFLNTSYRKPEDIETDLGLSILATVPLVLQPKQKRRQQLLDLASIASVAFSILLFFAFAVITSKGPDKTLEFISRFI